MTSTRFQLSQLNPFKKRPVVTPATPYPTVKLFHWKPANGSVNFGDQLSEVVVRKLLADHHISLDEEVREARNLFAIGSILHFANNGDCVWGSGWNGKVSEDEFKLHHLDVRAVRGPLTAEFLRKRHIAVPDVFGDPALLLPHLFPQKFKRTEPAASPASAPIIIPNLNELDLVSGMENVVSPLRGWNYVISSIVNASFVISSSLHGLIMANAFGVPAVYLRLSERENIFKYLDYHLGTGQPESSFVYARNLDEAKEMGGTTMHFDHAPLLNAFPQDLWR
jgi:pyruvyltransferase